MDKLHPGARWLFRLQAYYSLFFIGVSIIFYSFMFYRLKILRFSVEASARGLFILAIILYVFFVVVIAEIYARMSYNKYLYKITRDTIKIERGIIWKKYVSIPYERVQNVEIYRGIIARMLGFSTVEIETAGESAYGGSYGFGFGRRNLWYKSEGHLPAIDVRSAEKIRVYVMKRIKQTTDSGI